MRDSQLEKMSLKDLSALHAKIRAAIDEKRVSERHVMRAKMEEMAKASGFSVSKLLEVVRAKGVGYSPSTATRKIPIKHGPAAVGGLTGWWKLAET